MEWEGLKKSGYMGVMRRFLEGFLIDMNWYYIIQKILIYLISCLILEIEFFFFSDQIIF